MDLFNLAAKLTLDTGDYTKGINNAEGAFSRFGNGLKKIGTIATGAFTVAAGAVAGIAKQAVDAYAEFEQLEGGVETLFKTSADVVKENAQKAFETAGLSANEYMNMVTSFSASLIQSTGRGAQTDIDALKSTLDEEYKATKRNLEDQYKARQQYWDDRIRLTKDKNEKAFLKKQKDKELADLKRKNEDELAELKKHNKEVVAEAEAANSSSESSEESLERAAKLADMAVIDMADNANKMGTDVSAIQNAYAGFAKQNYTMLDNLKLGYGGTKEEMERLLKDAEKLTGKKYDLSSYADIVEAIHAIQTEMGISGLSYEEAMEKMEKEGWTWEQAVEAMGTTAKEASTTISGSFSSMKAAWQNTLVAFADKNGDVKKATKNLVRTVKTWFKNIAPVFTQAISGIGDFLSEIAPMIGEELPGIVAEVLPKLFEAGKKLVVGLSKGIFKALQKIKLPTWDDIKQAVSQAWNGIVNAVSNLGGLIFGKNEKGEVKWPTWEDVKNFALDAWDKIKSAAISLGTEFGKLVFGTTETGDVKWPTWEEIKGFALNAWEKIKSAALTLGTEFGKLVFGTTDTGDVNWPTWEDVKNAAISAWDAIKTAAANLGTEFGKLIFGTTDTGDVDWPTWEDVKDFALNAWEKIKSAAASLGTEFGKLVFGTTDKGEVAWPTWEDVVAKATEVWEGIKAGAKNLLGFVFGKKADGSVDFPTWSTVKAKALEIWESIKEEAKKLKGLIFGDAADAGSIFDSIKTSWETLRSTIEGGAIKIATYFFDDADPEKVANAVKTICDVLIALGAGVLTLTFVTRFEKMISGIKNLFSFDPKSKTALILAGIATAIALVVENWDKIEPVLKDIGKFIQDNIIAPITDAINAIKRFLGIRVNGELKQGEVDELKSIYEAGKYTDQNGNTQYAYSSFLQSMSNKMREAGFTEEQISAAWDVLKEHINDPDFVKKFLENMTDSKKATDELSKAIEAIPKDVGVTVHVNTVDDTAGLLSYGNAGMYAYNLKPKKKSKGDWNVPYDNYLASLHRGEMVLTASQARRYREGDDRGWNMTALEDRIIAAIRMGMADANVTTRRGGLGNDKQI